jgi:uncharacterized coiled-coil DUF342 family protein
MMDITKAIINLRPGASWSISGENYEDLWWSDENDLPPPTEEEINQEIERLQKEYENNQYQRDRAKEYPPIVDQLDALYHRGYDGWKSMIDEVKNKYPKPGEG